MRRLTLLSLLCLLALSAGQLFATATCPTATNGGFLYQLAGGGCNLLITFDVNGTPSVTTPNFLPYDGWDDMLIGVVNNSHTVITSFTISGAGSSGPNGGIFHFDGDGICGYRLSAGFTCTPAGSIVTTGGRNGYEGASLGFTNIHITSATDTGTVNFAGIAGNGGTSWFSLEESPFTAGTIRVAPSVPEPGSIVLFGTVGLLVAGFLRRRSA